MPPIITGPDNAHISTVALTSHLATELADLEERLGERVVVELMGVQKSGEDNTTRFLVRTASGRPKAVLNCSRPAAPDLIRRGVKIAEEIRVLAGPGPGEAIIRPLMSGYVDDRSYVMLPWYRDISSHKLLGFLQRRLLRRPLLCWLRKATTAAAEKHGHSEASSQAFASALSHLARQSFLDAGVQTEIEKSLNRLAAGKWQPRHSFDHNDLWSGNVLLTAGTGHGIRHRYPFVLIDWGGANKNGYGIYDLIRLARAFALSPVALHKELLAHSEALQCTPGDTRGHLLAALGRLHQNLECFPEERFAETVMACWKTMEPAVKKISAY